MDSSASRPAPVSAATTKADRPVGYNKTLEYIDKHVAQKATILIAPEKPLEISRVCHDPEVMQRVYDLGRRAAERISERT